MALDLYLHVGGKYISHLLLNIRYEGYVYRLGLVGSVLHTSALLLEDQVLTGRRDIGFLTFKAHVFQILRCLLTDRNLPPESERS